MRSRRGATASIAWAALAASTAAAGQTLGGPVTREQVLRELAEARRVGDMPAPGCGGGTLREQFPHRYPPRSVPEPGSTPAPPAGSPPAPVAAPVAAPARGGAAVPPRVPGRNDP